jgi:Uma2 family endonuclease
MFVNQDLDLDLPPMPPSDLWSDEPPLETYRHLAQIVLLLTCLEWLWQDRTDFFAAANLTIYYNLRQLKNKDFRGPDFFVVLGTERRERKSWVIWDEDGKYPNVILEILSDSTAAIDRGLKKQLYQDTFRTPEYFWFDPYSFEFAGFHLIDNRYEAIPSSEQGWLWSQQLELFLGVYNEKLRLFKANGELVLTPTEEAEQRIQEAKLAQAMVVQERQRAELERQRAEQEQQRAELEQQRAEQEQQRAELERQRAEQEQQRAELAEAQLAEEQQRSQILEARLKELGFNIE